jgi:hypothetical protein
MGDRHYQHILEEDSQFIDNISRNEEIQRSLNNTKKNLNILYDELLNLKNYYNFDDYENIDINNFDTAYDNFYTFIVDDFNQNKNIISEIKVLVEKCNKMKNQLEKKINKTSKKMNQIHLKLQPFKNVDIMIDKKLDSLKPSHRGPYLEAFEHSKNKKQNISMKINSSTRSRSSSSKKNPKSL